MPAQLNDGYIRMNYSALSALPLDHLLTFSDEDFLLELYMQGIPAASAGFSEWKTDASTAVSLGMGWYVDASTGHILLAPEPIRSNLMLIDRKGYDLGMPQTSSLLRNWLQSFNWQAQISAAVEPS
ncbi:MAG: hypothetical protein K0S28_545 [Paucimonas sp.]|jgi:hypothetical protein|nr:hypothetical protein [Paucimonas sp.]